MWRSSHDDPQGDIEAAAADKEEGSAGGCFVRPLSSQVPSQSMPERHSIGSAGGGGGAQASSVLLVSGSSNSTISLQEQQRYSSSPQASGSSLLTTQALPAVGGGGGGDITVVDDVRALEHVENHIVVLLPKATNKIQYLLRPLRAQFLRGTPFSKSVVILTEANVSQLERYCRSLEVRERQRRKDAHRLPSSLH